MTCLARSSSSEGVEGVGGVVSGGSPDLTSSPEVFTWMKTCRGVLREGGRCLLSAVAVLGDVRVWIAYMFGVTGGDDMGMRRGVLMRRGYLRARFFALLDCNVPIKCHRISVSSLSCSAIE